jgi:hypothetical protein
VLDICSWPNGRSNGTSRQPIQPSFYRQKELQPPNLWPGVGVGVGVGLGVGVGVGVAIDVGVDVGVGVGVASCAVSAAGKLSFTTTPEPGWRLSGC